MNRRYLAWFITILSGIAVGVFITLNAYRFFRKNGNFVSYDDVSLSIGELLVERERLVSRLREIDIKLNYSSPPITVSKDHLNPITQFKRACKYNFTVYVYEIPQSLLSIKVSEEARRNKTLHICQKCILEQFSLEYILYDFFTQFCGRTYDPSVADYFYLPIVRDAEYRLALQNHGPRSRNPSQAEEALLLLLEKNDSSLWRQVFGVTDRFWWARGGADHLIAMPAPVTNFRHQGSQRGFFHYMLHLHTPIFLAVEYSSSFIAEYPICSRRKNIVLPYPTTDPELFSGKLLPTPSPPAPPNASSALSVDFHWGPRKYLLYYAGGLHGDCIEVRKAMRQLLVNCSRLPELHLVPPVKANQEQRELGFLAATFCPVPIGDSPSSKRMYDVLNFGCVPVVLSDELVWAFSSRIGGPLNVSSFALHVPQSLVQFSARRTLARFASRRAELGVLPSGTRLYDLLLRAQREGADLNPLVQVLQRVPREDVEVLQRGGRHVAPFFRYYRMNVSMRAIPTAEHLFPDGEAVALLAAALEERKATGLAAIRDACVRETRGRHAYLNRYRCDTEKEDSLIHRRRTLSSS